MHGARGFTLVESLVALAAGAVMLSVAVPGLGMVRRSTEVASAASNLLAGLLLTRSEAIKRKVRVVMCRSQDGNLCAPAGNWQQGWIVFEDRDGDGQRDAGEPLLMVQPALPGTVRLTGTSTVAKYVSYAPTGMTRLVGGGFQAGTMTVCSASGQAGTGRQIVINASGRPRTQLVQLPSCG